MKVIWKLEFCMKTYDCRLLFNASASNLVIQSTVSTSTCIDVTATLVCTLPVSSNNENTVRIWLPLKGHFELYWDTIWMCFWDSFLYAFFYTYFSTFILKRKIKKGIKTLSFSSEIIFYHLVFGQVFSSRKRLFPRTVTNSC